MQTRSRRWYLGITGTLLATVLAGCGNDESEFLVTNTQLIHQDDHRINYPADILVRVSVENTYNRRQEGRLELTLVYEPEGNESVSWTLSDDISLAQGTSTIDYYVFEDVYEPGNVLDDYRLEGEIIRT